jgi:hypothetical protein
MLIVRGGREHGFGSCKLLCKPSPLISLFPADAGRVQGVVEGRVWDMKLVRIDSNNGAILRVQISYVKDVLTAQNHIIVEFIPGSAEGQLGLVLLSRTSGASAYQRVSAASLGPGNFDRGLTNSRYMASQAMYPPMPITSTAVLEVERGDSQRAMIASRQRSAKDRWPFTES